MSFQSLFSFMISILLLTFFSSSSAKTNYSTPYYLMTGGAFGSGSDAESIDDVQVFACSAGTQCSDWDYEWGDSSTQDDGTPKYGYGVEIAQGHTVSVYFYCADSSVVGTDPRNPTKSPASPANGAPKAVYLDYSSGDVSCRVNGYVTDGPVKYNQAVISCNGSGSSDQHIYVTGMDCRNTTGNASRPTSPKGIKKTKITTGQYE